jgi:hypothetical protein
MDGQVTARALVQAIPDSVVGDWLTTRLAELRQALVDAVAKSLKPGMRAVDVLAFEGRVELVVRELARSVEEFCFNALEPLVAELPPQVERGGNIYRRLRIKTRHAQILTRFGNITLTRATYRLGSRGTTIAPLEKVLGIECGATPGALDLVGRVVAAAGSSQERAIEIVQERTGATIGSEKLRSLSAYLTEILEPQREVCQVQQLEQWIDDVVKRKETVTLAISRDGVSLGIAPFGNFEMASVATLSIYGNGKRIGTVYLACAPQENQETLSRNCTSILTAIIRSRDLHIDRYVYVTDAGKIETAYWKNVLRKFYVDGVRIQIERILDYYHASLRLTSIADALLLTTSQRTEWLTRVRKLLLNPSGWGRVMHSIAGMVQKYGIKTAEQSNFEKAKRYLHRYRRFMNYAAYRSQGCPIGSGVVESACKQIVSERLKLSGMRWSHAGAQQIMTLRSILLSQTWPATFHQALLSHPPVNALCHQHPL